MKFNTNIVYFQIQGANFSLKHLTLFKMKKHLIKIATLCLGITLLISGCKKKDTDTVVEADNNEYSAADASSVSDDNSAQNKMDDVQRIVDDNMSSNGLNREDDSKVCYTVSVNTNKDTMNIDFGTGCLGDDGVTRSGKIMVVRSGRYKALGSITTVTFDGYTVGGVGITGKKVVTHSTTTKGTYAIVENATLTLGSNISTWSSVRTRVYTAGFDTDALSDDKIVINGTTTGISNGSVDFTSVIKDVVIDFNCWTTSRLFPTSGTKTYTVQKKAFRTRTIDYGKGDCDRSFTVTFSNGKSIPVTL
jgi:hypothetical protein